MKLPHHIIAIGCLGLTTSITFGATYYVSTSGNDNNNGLTLQTAFGTVQKGVDSSSNGDTVIVQQGTYNRASGSTQLVKYNGKAITVRSTDPNDPNVVAATILDANIPGTAGYRVVTFSNSETSSSRLEGFTIKGGYSTTTNYIDGGGIYCSSASPRIYKCIITYNRAKDGGGIYASGSNVILNGCQITHNTALVITESSGGNGGGMRALNSSPTITDCNFAFNTAAGGGGLQNNNSTPQVRSCIFYSNSTISGGTGGAAMRNVSSAAPDVNNCTFISNTSQSCGGGINSSSCSPTIANSQFTGNTALADGGALYSSTSGTVIVKNCIFEDNTGTGNSGAIYSLSLSSNSKIQNSVFIDNHVTNSGSSSNRRAMVISEGSTCPIITNCTFSGNHTASYKYALYRKGTEVTEQVTNCIFWDNSGYTEIYPSGMGTVTYSDIRGGYTGTGNIDSDPNFTSDGYHINSSSPCKDAGDPNGSYMGQKDIDDANRINNGCVDIGADEYLATYYTISGSTGIDDVTMSGLPGNPVTSGGGLYSAQVISGWSGTVTPSKTGYTFTPASKNYSNVTANQTSQNYTAAQTSLTYYVATTGNDNNNGSEQAPFRTIQKGLNSSSNGYTIIVAQGHYYEKISFGGKKVRLTSTDPTNQSVVSATIIDANDTSYNSCVVTLNQDEDVNSILDGFTIKRGWAGIYTTSSPVIQNCTVTNNSYYGISCDGYGQRPQIEKCRAMNNSYGIQSVFGVSIKNCIAAHNSSVGIRVCYNNYNAEIVNCTVYGNGDYGITDRPDTILNCIIWGNNDDLNITTGMVRYCCIEDNDTGTGVIHTYPSFVNADTNDFHLQIGSQCIDMGDPCSAYNLEPNGGGGRIDIGAYGNTPEATTRGSCHHGLPDSWILQYWPDANLDTFDPNADADGDGLRNKDEYNLGWDPTISNSGSIKGFVTDQRTGYRYPSLQMAIDFADRGDVVVAEPNHFYEKISFKSKRIHLRSTDPNDPNVVAATIIDANNTATGNSAVTFRKGEDANSILDGFTVTRACYGINCINNSSPRITNCTIRNNSFAGIYCYMGSANIDNCRVLNNQVWGVEAWDELMLQNSVIAKNSNGGVATQTFSNKQVVVHNCTIVSNRTGSSGSGIYGRFDEVKNCIIWDNGDDLLACGNCPMISAITYSCIEDSDSGTGVIHSNPMFVNPDANDYHLMCTSPCIDAGDPSSTYSNESDYPHGHIDIGAYGNTLESTSNVDLDGDGIADEWQRYYWPSYDPNSPDPDNGPNGNPDGDEFSNLVEYLFNYNPIVTTTAPMAVDCYRISPVVFDPTDGNSLAVEYRLNKAASEVKIDFIRTSGSIAREIIQTSISAGKHSVVWDGLDANGVFAAPYLYDLKITAIAQSNPSDTYTWTSNNIGNTAPGLIAMSASSDYFSAYTNIPVAINFDLTDWQRGTLYIKSSGAFIRTLFTGKFFSPGQHTVYWDGRNDNGQIHEGNFAVNMLWIDVVRNGAFVVYYSDPLTNLKCNPYRIIPTYDEITTVTYDLAYAADVTIDIKDPDGQYFTTLLNNVHQNTGSQQVKWYGKNGDPNSNGSRYPSKEGVYTIEVKTANPSYTLKGVITVFK